MVEKLRSTLRIIRWSSPTKAAAFAVGWLTLPGWAFFALAFALYLLPVFRPFALAVPFLVLLYLTSVAPSGVPAAVFFGAVFFLILGIKDLVLIRRTEAYQALAYLLLFGTYLDLFRHAPYLLSPGMFARSLLAALVTYLLARPLVAGSDPASRILAAAGALLLWQWSWALVFLPLNHFAQAALQMLGAITFIELASAYGSGMLDRRKILTQFTIFFLFFVIVLAANSWRV